jgi:hypothetical protein
MASDPDRWRAGLQTKGRDWVVAELRMRAGLPDDPLYDVVHESPHPTREFCRRWCVEADNAYFRISGTTKAAICALAFFAVFLAMAMHSLTKTESAQPHVSPSHGSQE